MSDESPILVVGAPRSGTTLTAKILDLHPEVHSPGESHFFEDIWTRRAEFGELKSDEQISAAVNRIITLFGSYNFPETQAEVDGTIDRDRLINQVKAKGGGYGVLYDCFLETLAKTNHKRLYCDDTPKHLFYLETIFKILPKAKVICCVRDPRDFLCSYKYYWQRSTESERVRALYHPIITSMVWRSSTRKIIDTEPVYTEEQIEILQYEQLVANPESEVQRLCEFLGIEFDLQMIDVGDSNSSFKEMTRGIYATGVGRWRSCLTPHETWWTQRMNGNLMERFGYKIEPIRSSWWRVILDAVTSPFALFRALYANRKKRGPTLQYLKRRFTSL